MSGTLKVTTLQDGASATANLTFDTSANTTAGGTVAMASSFKRNRIINGNMLIDQRYGGAATGTSINGYTVDRWFVAQSVAGKLDAQQSAAVYPVGFTKSLSVTSQSAYTVGAADVFAIQQPIEGMNVADLAWGTANAKTVTMSFQVYSSLTGTFSGSVRNSATDRYYIFTYTIASANTWTPVSITIAGDTTGTWLTTNGVGIYLTFGLGIGSTYSATAGAWGTGNKFSATGSTSVVGTSGATFYLTGVQLEVGTKATPYEMQIYSDQLAQCQRYYETQDWQQNTFRIAVVFSNNDYINMYQAFVVPKRAVPSVTWTGNGSGRWISSPGVATSSITVDTRFNTTATGCSVSSTALYASYSFGWIDTLGTMQISAEL